MANEVSNAALAYLGDCVIELKVRKFLVECGISHSADLNREALVFVKAGAQSEAVKKLLPILTDEETAVFKRGRNNGHSSAPKSATVGQYRAATGMETLFGQLYLDGKFERIDELFAAGYSEQIEKLKEKR